MKVRDPHDLISEVDLKRFNSLKELKAISSLNDPESLTMSLNYVEPNGSGNPISNEPSSFQAPDVAGSPGINRNEPKKPFDSAAEDDVLKGKIQRLGDYIDTDAVCSTPLVSGFNTHANRYLTSAGTSRISCTKQNQ